MSVMYRDREGNPLPLHWWEATPDWYAIDKRVGSTVVGDVRVSTVWMAIEHPGGMFFETMLFGGEHDLELQRYRTEEAAMRGHLEVVDRLRAGKPAFDWLEAS